MKIVPSLLFASLAFLPLTTPAQAPAGCGGSSTLKDTYSAADATRAERFLGALQSAVAANDKARVAAMVQYPLRVNLPDHTHRLIRTPQQLRAKFDWIFTTRTRAAIHDQVPACMFANAQGAMIGDGEVWFQDYSGSFRIWSFNRM